MVASVENRAPGVYLEQVAVPPQPTLATGVPAFLGLRLGSASSDLVDLAVRLGVSALFADKPTPVALELTTWTALDALVGPQWASQFLGFAVRAFFQNGGRRCYVVTHDDGNLVSALETLDALDDFDIVCAPDTAEVVGDLAAAYRGRDTATVASDQAAVIDLCRRRPGCFALLDGVGAPLPHVDITVSRIKAGVDAISNLCDESQRINSAIYAPWVKVEGACPTCAGQEPYCSSCGYTGQGYVPPSGYVAGVVARLDARIGVHRAPANEPIEGVFNVQLALDLTDVADLNQAGVNAIRALPGRGIRPWGARTLAPNHADFAHVNMRRTYLTIARWLEVAMADLTFEPNDLRLWLAIDRRVSAFLQGLYSRGALSGSRATEAFYIKCDAETNPPSVRDAGMVVTEIGVSLARPNEFIVLRLHAGAGTASVSGA